VPRRPVRSQGASAARRAASPTARPERIGARGDTRVRRGAPRGRDDRCLRRPRRRGRGRARRGPATAGRARVPYMHRRAGRPPDWWRSRDPPARSRGPRRRSRPLRTGRSPWTGRRW